MRYFKDNTQDDRVVYYSTGGAFNTKITVFTGNERPVLIENESVSGDPDEITSTVFHSELDPTMIETIAGSRPNVIR